MLSDLILNETNSESDVSNFFSTNEYSRPTIPMGQIHCLFRLKYVLIFYIRSDPHCSNQKEPGS